MDNIDKEIEELLEQTSPCDKGIMYDAGWGTVQIYYDAMKDRVHIRILHRSDEELKEIFSEILDETEMPPGPWHTDISIKSLPLLCLLGVIEK